MAETENQAPAGALTEADFMADRVKFWDAWTGFTLHVSISLVFLLIYLWSGAVDGFSFSKTLLLIVACVLVFARVLI